MVNWNTVNRALEPIATVFVLAAAGLLIWTQVENRWLRPTPGAPQRVSGAIEGSQIRHSNGRGAIALIEFTDYECPYCGKYSRETAPEVDRQFVQSGKVRHIVLNFPLDRIHPNARRAGQAAECASRQGKFWDMHQYLFGHQDKLTPEGVRQAAVALGLQMDEFDQCLDGGADHLIAADLKEGERLGVVSTPSFFVGSVQPDGSIQLSTRFSGAAPFSDVAKIVNNALGSPHRRWLWW